MSMLELNLPAKTMERLQSEAERRNMPVVDLVSEAIESYLEEDVEFEDENEATILEDLRQSLKQIVAGQTYPIDELFDKSRRVPSSDAD